jgi:hypothetical protein
MKQKKSTTSKPKLSFTVDRDEVDINSDWVQAVMGPPSLPRHESPFFAADINNATAAQSATEAKIDTVEEIAPDAKSAGVPENATVVENATGNLASAAASPPPPVERGGVADSVTVAYTATVAEDAAGLQNVSGADNATAVPLAHATVTYIAPAAQGSTVALSSGSRLWKLRPLRRITDGLTPGQYAVYSLMLANCDEAGQGGEVVYRGGYADLGQLTGLSKRGIQNVIGELQQKRAIRLHTAPGHHRTQTSAYVVPKPEAVLEIWHGRGWRFAVGKSKCLTDGTTVALLATQGAA